MRAGNKDFKPGKLIAELSTSPDVFILEKGEQQRGKLALLNVERGLVPLLQKGS